MAITHKILGQSKPAAATAVTLYTVPANTAALLTVKACNQAAVSDTIRVALIPSGGSLGAASYIAYGLEVLANLYHEFEHLALRAGDSVVIWTDNATTSFTATGLEFS